MRNVNQPPVHPFGPVLIALIAIVVLGLCYLVIGVGKDALTYAFGALMVFGLPVVIVFGLFAASGRIEREEALPRHPVS
jgi:hypothetical protein